MGKEDKEREEHLAGEVRVITDHSDKGVLERGVVQSTWVKPGTTKIKNTKKCVQSYCLVNMNVSAYRRGLRKNTKEDRKERL